MWTACCWPSLLQLVHLGIHRGLVSKVFCLYQSLVVLSEGHNFCCNKQEAIGLNNVRSGNKAVLNLFENTSVATCANRFPKGLRFMESETNSCQRKVGPLGCAKYLVAHLLFYTASRESSYLVDPASSHMLVSKIKPCMSKYKQICTVKLRMAH
jgi:hypothetical protein